MWNRFVWPYIEKLANVLIAKDYIPVLHWDQNWTRDLERLNDLPPGKCILNPDGMTSMRKFKEVAGNSMVMMGDVSSVLLSTGTPEDVTRYVRELVDLFEGKGLLMCAGCDAPINARPENIEAMYRALEH
jgi:uroporphyrinogen-III decarboxylase